MKIVGSKSYMTTNEKVSLKYLCKNAFLKVFKSLRNSGNILDYLELTTKIVSVFWKLQED